MRMRIDKNELTEEQITLLSEAGKQCGIAVQDEKEHVIIEDLSRTQFAQLAYGFQEHWGLSLSVRVESETDQEVPCHEP